MCFLFFFAKTISAKLTLTFQRRFVKYDLALSYLGEDFIFSKNLVCMIDRASQIFLELPASLRTQSEWLGALLAAVSEG